MQKINTRYVAQMYSFIYLLVLLKIIQILKHFSLQTYPTFFEFISKFVIDGPTPEVLDLRVKTLEDVCHKIVKKSSYTETSHNFLNEFLYPKLPSIFIRYTQQFYCGPPSAAMYEKFDATPDILQKCISDNLSNLEKQLNNC